MQEIIVSDTSCLILLDKINKLNILKLIYKEVFVTNVVAEEYKKPLPKFIKIKNPSDIDFQQKLEITLDKGEASSIVLAMENNNHLLIIDELKGRKKALDLKLNITGTIGVFIIAKEKGFIQSVSNILFEIEKTNFRISKNFIKEIKKQCNEL